MITRGNIRGRVTLQIQNGVFWVKIEQDPRGEDLVACFAEARETNLLPGPMPTIVDMLAFNGSIDWNAIAAVREMTPWEKQAQPKPGAHRLIVARCGYISTDPLLAPVIKILCDLFGRSRHRQFRNPEQALLWVLQNEAPPPESVTDDDD
jgi:hypothetical protein